MVDPMSLVMSGNLPISLYRKVIPLVDSIGSIFAVQPRESSDEWQVHLIKNGKMTVLQTDMTEGEAQEYADTLKVEAILNMLYDHRMLVHPPE